MGFDGVTLKVSGVFDCVTVERDLALNDCVDALTVEACYLTAPSLAMKRHLRLGGERTGKMGLLLMTRNIPLPSPRAVSQEVPGRDIGRD